MYDQYMSEYEFPGYKISLHYHPTMDSPNEDNANTDDVDDEIVEKINLIGTCPNHTMYDSSDCLLCYVPTNSKS